MDEIAQIAWEGDSLKVLRAFPKGIREDLGAELFRLQLGVKPMNSRPMKSIGARVFELKEQDSAGWYRVIYLAKVGQVLLKELLTVHLVKGVAGGQIVGQVHDMVSTVVLRADKVGLLDHAHEGDGAVGHVEPVDVGQGPVQNEYEQDRRHMTVVKRALLFRQEVDTGPAVVVSEIIEIAGHGKPGFMRDRSLPADGQPTVSGE